MAASLTPQRLLRPSRRFAFDRPPISKRDQDAVITSAIALLCEIEGLRAAGPLGEVASKSLPGALRVREALACAGVKLPPALGGEV